MLTPEQRESQLSSLTGGDAIVMLQLIQRMSANGLIKDEELTVLGETRDNIKNALSETTGVDFDVERARQYQIIQEAQRLAKEKEATESEEA